MDIVKNDVLDLVEAEGEAVRGMDETPGRYHPMRCEF